MSDLLVGFDLDMTLIDSRPGIKAVYQEVSRRTGIPIDADLVVTRLGPPLEIEMANWFPADQVDDMADLYRALYAEHALPLIGPMPGAIEALAAVRESGRAIVITAKNVIHARSHVAAFGFDPADVFGSVWREGKADVLRAVDATIYVGDHVHDMEAAASAGVIGVGVATGPNSADELTQNGAHAVLNSLTEFPLLLDSGVLSSR